MGSSDAGPTHRPRPHMDGHSGRTGCSSRSSSRSRSSNDNNNNDKNDKNNFFLLAFKLQKRSGDLALAVVEIVQCVFLSQHYVENLKIVVPKQIDDGKGSLEKLKERTHLEITAGALFNGTQSSKPLSPLFNLATVMTVSGEMSGFEQLIRMITSTEGGGIADAKMYEFEKDLVCAKMRSYGLTEEDFKKIDNNPMRTVADQLEREGKFRRSMLLLVLNSRFMQALTSLILIFGVVLAGLEVDANYEQRQLIDACQYMLTSAFLLEAVLYMICVPKFWNENIVVDIATSVCLWVAETATVLSHLSVPGMLVIIRTMRFIRLIQHMKGASITRTLNIMIRGFNACLMNAVWVLLFLGVFTYILAILFRSLLKDSGGDLEHDFFPSVARTMLTIWHAMLGGFDVARLITWPLMTHPKLMFVGYLWVIIHDVLTRLIILNLVGGLFVEQIMRAAKVIDEYAEKEHLLLDRVTFNKCLDEFEGCDPEQNRSITIKKLLEGVSASHGLRRLLGIKKRQDDITSEVESFFYANDPTGRGTLSFADFTFGILTRRTSSNDLRSIVYEQASRHIMRHGSQSKTVLRDTASAVSRSIEEVRRMRNTFEEEQRLNTTKLQALYKQLQIVGGKIEKVYGVFGGDNVKFAAESMSQANIKRSRDLLSILHEVHGRMGSISHAMKNTGSRGESEHRQDDRQHGHPTHPGERRRLQASTESLGSVGTECDDKDSLVITGIETRTSIQGEPHIPEPRQSAMPEIPANPQVQGTRIFELFRAPK
eukprot:TRINITY_DN12096_c0_g11_i1.p1 TRINITY_DN12096_c0_g11~~TRINITY_DN12096_c0_g11_i1.p1  ORF type:complete len:768 (+),score=103.44 TRINITY_DN12096_c0_g11_i1:286-2589(+)